MNNAFNDLYELMGQATKIQPSFYLGEVVSGLPNIKIGIEGLILEKDDILISNSLIIFNNANITCSQGNIDHNLKSILSSGNKIIATKIGEKFIIIDKVVSL